MPLLNIVSAISSIKTEFFFQTRRETALSKHCDTLFMLFFVRR